MIRIARCHRRHRHLVDRIEQTADHYGRTVARKLGGRLPDVRILVTDSRGMVRAAAQADVDLAGGSTRARRAANGAATWWHGRHAYGVTAYDRGGLLVAINGAAHRDLRELDRTLIHELAHTVQLNAPGAREQHATYVRMLLGAQPRDPKFIASYERRIDTRETQARNLETLA